MPDDRPPTSHDPHEPPKSDRRSSDGEVPPRWGLRHAVVGFVVANILAGLAQAIYTAVRGLDEIDLDAIPLRDFALIQLPFTVGLIAVPLLVTRYLGAGPVHDLWLRFRRWDAPVGVALGIVCQLLLVPAVTYPVLWLSGQDMDDVSEPARSLTDRADAAGVTGVVFLVLIVGIMAPVAEEIFYRGLVQRGLGRHLPVVPTLVLSGVVFGASHLQALQFPALATFGVVLAALVHRTERLGIAIWTHLGFNLTTVVLLLTVS